MKFFLTALLLGFVSMVIVFVSGLTSGVVGLGTLAIRTVFSFAMTSAATYFVMMLFDYYEEMRLKELKKAIEEVAPEETPTENTEVQPPQESESFQPMNADNLPNIEK